MSARRQDEMRECASNNNSNTEKTLEPADTNVSGVKDFVCPLRGHVRKN